ncbi:hypothetical protein OF83DRAFT_1170122 [Amylostereum chailletii]|nr:hypothetical protein OF83DRAFT_1170122 [Amylostereum chailletii]
MRPRRNQTTPQALSPYDPSPTVPAGPSSTAFPRATSPSGISQLLAKPAKWFSRNQGTRPRAPSGSSEPRSSTSSYVRKPKISQPTDPRPILPSVLSEPYLQASPKGPSRSVHDLSLTRTRTAVDVPRHAPQSPGSPSRRKASAAGLGDLRSLSHKPWSRSAEELGKFSVSAPSTPATATFQDKVTQYRGTSPGHSPSTSNGQQYLFPIITSQGVPIPPSSPGSSPGSLSPLMTTMAGSPPSSPTNTHLHVRSHSFTPKLPSKLSASKLGPTSPTRKMSGSSEKEMPMSTSRERDRVGHGGRGAFPFTFGAQRGSPANDSPLTSTPGESPLLPPPTIIEPTKTSDALDSTDNKRASQITFHSGFINRLMDFTPPISHGPSYAHTLPTSSKSWKPFKLILRGTKLQFYKPPNDRTTAVKDLFPVGIVAVEEEDETAETEGNRDEPPAEEEVKPTPSRRKRAFWGRKTHPDLGLDGQGVVGKGTLEALVHEAVFATTFSDALPRESASTDKSGWEDFALSVLFGLPTAVGRSKFETEFIRFASFLVSGAADEHKEQDRARVHWLATEYLRFYGTPADAFAWEEFREETIPDFSPPPSRGFPTSVSTQAIHTSSPLLGAESPNIGPTSPNFGAFSPRPEADPFTTSMQERLWGPRSAQSFVVSPSSPAKSRSAAPRDALWGVLEREGFTKHVLVRLMPQEVAHSLFVFNLGLLVGMPENLTVEDCLGPSGELARRPSDQYSEEPTSRSSPSILQPFAGSDAHPHWLTKLILLHVLGPDSSYNTSRQSGRFSVDLSQAAQATNQPTSRTYSRSEVITAWARVGELCRLAGDECSWRAIFAALCCRPIARLEKTWKRVEGAALAMVEGWVAREESEAMERRLTPWAGSTLEDVQEAIQKAMSEDEQTVWAPRYLKEAKDAFEGFRTAFSLCPRGTEQSGEDDFEDVPRLVAAWKELSATGGGVGNIASQFVHTEQFMSLSVAAESRRKGHYEPIFWSQASSATTPANQCLVPLIFPEPLPYISFVDRSQFLRPRVDSGGPTRMNVQDIQNLRKPDAGLVPLTTNRRRSFGAENRDGLHTLDFGGTVIPLFDNELLLLVQPGPESTSRPSSRPSSRPASRPPSALVEAMILDKPVARAPSIRVRPAAGSRPGPSQGGLDRKQSLARRNSLPSISQRTSLVVSDHSHNERPVRVVVQAGTLERLVNVLAHGLPGVSVSIADDNGEMPLRDKRTRDVKLDRAEFAGVWWNVFRSFVSPLVFFELLRKNYVSIPKPTPPRVDDLVNLAAQRYNILEVILDWLQNGGTQDILNDGALFNAVQSFLGSKEDHSMPASLDKDEEKAVESWAVFKLRLKAAQSLFNSQTRRPSARSGTVMDVLGVSSQSNRSAEPLDFSKTTPEELVESLDAMAAAAMRNVSEEDLFITADLLEVQTSDRLGWFIPWEPSHNSDETEIQNIYSHLTEVPPSSTGFELAQDELFRLFPPAIRSSLRAHHVLRKWVVSQLVAPRIGIQARQGRIELLLQAVEICRLRSEAETSPVPYTEQRCVRSFAELVLTAAIVSPESRAHVRAWTNVANARGVSSDSLMAYMSKPVRRAAPVLGPLLTTDLGWILERVLEVLSLPDVYDSGSDVGRVINFEKRRYLSHLLVDSQSQPSARTRSRRDISRIDLERLSHIEQQLANVHLDLRAIREEAHREGAMVPAAGSAKRTQRPFQRLVHMQMEKNKRDRMLYDRFNKERKQEQHRTDKRDDYFNKAMHTRRPSTALQKQHRMKKSGSVTFFQQLMRPISSALSLDNVEAIVDKRTAAELDFTPTGKPALALNVVDARAAPFVNYDRSYTFQLDTEDGGHYLLQATSKAEMNKWIRILEHVSKTAAQRRLTWLGNSPKPQLSDHIHDSNITPSRDPRAVYGVDLDVLLKRDTGGAPPPPGTIPSVVERFLQEVESRGLGEVGIYRIAGANSEVTSLKEALNRGLWPITSSTDIYAVCDLIKTWFRVLPEPVFPSYSYYDVINAMKMDDLNARMERIRVVIQALPRPNFDLLKRIIEHLDKVTDFEEQNQMTSDALAIVFSPNLLRAPHNDFLMIMANMPQTNKLVKMLVTHFHTIFDEVDADAEAEPEDDDADDDLIPEEDEDDEDEDVVSSPDPPTSNSYPAHEYPSAC